MKKIFASALVGAFLLVNVPSVAANTIDLSNEEGWETLQDENPMAGYQRKPLPKNVPELIAWLAYALLEKGIEWVNGEENREQADKACHCYSEWQDEGNQGANGYPGGQKYFGNFFNTTDYDDDDEEELTEEELSMLNNFCF